MSTERDEYETCGLEMPDLTDAKNLDYITNEWGGELRYVQNIKLRRFRKSELESGQFVEPKKVEPEEKKEEKVVEEKEEMETDE